MNRQTIQKVHFDLTKEIKKKKFSLPPWIISWASHFCCSKPAWPIRWMIWAYQYVEMYSHAWIFCSFPEIQSFTLTPQCTSKHGMKQALMHYLYFLSARLLLGTVQDHLHWLSHAEGLTIQECKRAWSVTTSIDHNLGIEMEWCHSRPTLKQWVHVCSKEIASVIQCFPWALISLSQKRHDVGGSLWGFNSWKCRTGPLQKSENYSNHLPSICLSTSFHLPALQLHSVQNT